ncbi:MAG TPA: hypothetical protein VH209_19375 [Steroidobacteraceae bacterium]|nr:hypothetical protein [Steroidobacteraceae bacterium]
MDPGQRNGQFADPNAEALARLCIRLVLVSSGFAGCSALPSDPTGPYFTYPPQPVTGDPDARPRVAICYDGSANALTTVQKAAEDECGPGTLANLIDTEWRLYYCPPLLPTRATFVCKPKK